MDIKLSVIVVSWNTSKLLDETLYSLRKELDQLPLSFEVFVVDNASSDDSVKMVKEKFPWVKLIVNSKNLGFGSANNQAFKVAVGEYVLLLNPDTIVLPNSILPLINFFDTHTKTGIVSPQLINTDGSIQKSCQRFPTLSGMFFEFIGLRSIFPGVKKFGSFKMLDFDHNHTRQVDQPEGACMLIPKKVLDSVGWFDEKIFMFFEDVDLCYRIKQAGWEIWFTVDSKIIHHLGQAVKKSRPKMIHSAHRGLYYFWTKNHHRWFEKLLSPFLFVALEGLAYLRVLLYKVKHF